MKHAQGDAQGLEVLVVGCVDGVVHQCLQALFDGLGLCIVTAVVVVIAVVVVGPRSVLPRVI